MSGYSKQYDALKRAGHNKPTPSVGTPTLVWHIGIWHRAPVNNGSVEPKTPEKYKYRGADGKPVERKLSLVERLHADNVLDMVDTQRKLIKQINQVLANLQERGRSDTRMAVGRDEIEQLKWVAPLGWPVEVGDEKDAPLLRFERATYLSEPFRVLEKDSRAFTLWWGDGDGPANYANAMAVINNQRKGNDNGLLTGPAPDMLRVRVQADVSPDYVTLTFYIDAGRSWNHEAIDLKALDKPVVVQTSSMKDVTADPSRGVEAIDPSILPRDGAFVWGMRRGKIFEAVRHIRQISEGRIDPKVVALPLIPEDASIDQAKADALQNAADMLYDGIWGEFEQAFDISIDKISKNAGEVFSNFRGVILSTSGIGKSELDELRNLKEAESNAATQDVPRHPAAIGFERQPRFIGDGSGAGERGRENFEPNEAHVIAKAFWPFIRRCVEDMDFKEYLACGVFNYRALYFTALGSRSELDEGDEWDYKPEPINRTADLPLVRRTPAADGKDLEKQPVRFLMITKDQPPRRQLSRIIERINSMNTVRLIALKDWPMLVNADALIRQRGMELDRILDAFTTANEFHRPKFYNPVTKTYDDDVGLELGASAYETGMELDKLGTSINKIGDHIQGGLSYRVSRSRMYATEFETLVKSLGVGNIDTWIAYDQFVDRNVRPLYGMIDGLGKRLGSFRERLQSAVELVQATALVLQTSATRSNTDKLRDIEQENDRRNFFDDRRERNNRWATSILGFLAIVVGLGSLDKDLSAKWSVLKPVFDFLMRNRADIITGALIIACGLAILWLAMSIWRSPPPPERPKAGRRAATPPAAPTSADGSASKSPTPKQ